MSNNENSSSFSSSSSKRDEEQHSITMSTTVSNTQIPILNIGASINVENIDIINPREISGSRRRGRPLGSKNKPKETATEIEPMKAIVLEVPHGVNIIDWVANFSQSREVSVIISGGFGSVSQVSFWHPGTQLLGTIYYEDLKLVSLSGVYIFYRSIGSSTTSFFNASLARVNGGIVFGSALQMITRGSVMLTVFVFSDMKAFKIEALA